jgi:peptidoglycan/xylan/chitin deacetylase (PgdA/CDA1 family)/SAM-dependent methyltransferase
LKTESGLCVHHLEDHGIDTVGIGNMAMNNVYTPAYYSTIEEGSRRSAREIVPLVLELTHPRNVVDVGCGPGTWLSVFEEFGIEEYLGIDGDHIDPNLLQIPRDRFVPFDLKNPLQLDRQFDLVVSLEVAEHLPVTHAETFIDSVTSLGPVVLFSAAIPLQWGENHLNGRWPCYWVQHFSKKGYIVVDCLRKTIWNRQNVEPWYAQNMLIFVRQDRIARYPLLKSELERTDVSQLAMVHPDIPRHSIGQVTEKTQWSSAEKICAVQIEITEPMPDISPSGPAERLQCTVELEGARIGMIELPVCEGLVPSHVLADAIAAEFAWPIIGWFFERTVYRDLSLECGPTSMSLHRGALCLADGLTENECPAWLQPHKRVGWAVFLQEIWGRPNWPQARFYDPQTLEAPSTRRRVNDGWLTVEVSDKLPDVLVPSQELDVVPTVGGVPLGVVTVPVERYTVRAQELRAAITGASGFELCRAAVREGLLGRPLEGSASLRDRLAAAASKAAQLPGWSSAPGSARALGCALSPGEPCVMLGRRTQQAFGTSASRRAILPAAAARELVDAAAAAGEPVFEAPHPGERPAHVVYAPELIQRLPERTEKLTVDARSIHPPSDSTQRSADVQAVVTDRLPILVYHRVAPADSPAMARHPVTPEAFEEQLQYLHDTGFYSVRLEEWHTAMEAHEPLPGRAVLITFDGGYLDFLTYAWPLLKQYDFSATVFLVADEIGMSSGWDRVYGEEIALLGWEAIHQIHDEGGEFGSLSASHRPLTALSLAEVVREGARSRVILSRGLGAPIYAFAYPYGEVDPVIEHLIGACGYVFGLSRRPVCSRYHDSPLALPRIEVTGSDGLLEFVAKHSL